MLRIGVQSYLKKLFISLFLFAGGLGCIGLAISSLFGGVDLVLSSEILKGVSISTLSIDVIISALRTGFHNFTISSLSVIVGAVCFHYGKRVFSSRGKFWGSVKDFGSLVKKDYKKSRNDTIENEDE